MESEIRRSILRQTYTILGVLLETFEELQTPYVGAQELNDLNVSFSKLDIASENPIDFEPRFLQPMPVVHFNHTFDKLNKKSEWQEGPVEFYGELSRYDEGCQVESYLRKLLSQIEQEYYIQKLEPNWKRS